jgi:UDP-N-acetylmuramoyl-L-alanyl-D-glutamate--2,6-diaminopimelate ligase
MTLNDLLLGDAHPNINITGITLDSRAVQTGNVFIALAGSQQHGLVYAEQAIKQGAAAIVYDPAGGGVEYAARISTDIPMLAIENLGKQLGDIAARFYGDPSSLMTVIGITGTNGKTSCSQFLSQLLADCGIIGTLGWGEWGNLHKTLNTTPDALAIQHIFAELLASGKKTVAMEVSSHGLEQGRVNGVRFDGAVFTNISRDHLDYHGSMENYLQAKLALLSTPDLGFVVVNLDDDYSEQILAAVPDSVRVWGVTHAAATSKVHELISATDIVNHLGGIEFTVSWRGESYPVSIPLYGDFNVENVLCVLAVMLALNVLFKQACQRLSQLQAVAGRMQRLGGGDKPLVFVDYAHTPDALEKVLASVRKHCTQDLWLVFGCGGNRDAGKRAMMGACAEHGADKIIVTDDNPRFENSRDIIEAILSGCEHPETITVQAERALAIQTAITQAQAGDCVIIAGKGHEDYQEINGERQPFSDSVCVLNVLNKD